MYYYITGDIHGSVERIERFCNMIHGEEKESVLIILGDCGFNYYLNERDAELKQKAQNLGITLFCIKGNHELHPDMIKSYKAKEWNGAPVFYEEEYPNILFAKDGEIYNICGRKVFVLGGAYSVDKPYRLAKHWMWFDSEQPSMETKIHALNTLDKNGWKADIVLTHTAPLKTEPVHMFNPLVDQKTVDKSTEVFLDEISDKLDFGKWYFGHFHGDWINGKYEMLFEKISYLFMDKYDKQKKILLL